MCGIFGCIWSNNTHNNINQGNTSNKRTYINNNIINARLNINNAFSGELGQPHLLRPNGPARERALEQRLNKAHNKGHTKVKPHFKAKPKRKK